MCCRCFKQSKGLRTIQEPSGHLRIAHENDAPREAAAGDCVGGVLERPLEVFHVEQRRNQVREYPRGEKGEGWHHHIQ